MAESDLRPMSLGEVLDRMFTLYRNNFWLFAGIVSLPLLCLLMFQIGTAALQYRGATHPATIGHPAGPGTIAGFAVGAIVGIVVYFVMMGAAQAATIFAVSELYLGRSATVRGSFGKVRGKVLRAVGVIILTSLMVGFGFILFIIPGFIVLARTGVAVPASMLEDESPTVAIGRSMDLTKGFGMQMFLIFVLVWVLGMIGAAVFQYPFLFLAAAHAARHQPYPFAYLMLQHLASFVSSVLVGPIGAIAFSLMYYNLRVRKEAFDLEHLMASLPPATGPVSPMPGAPSAA